MYSLPSWADTYTNGNLHILYGGFNPQWAAGQLEREVINNIAHKLASLHTGKVLVVVPNWYEPRAVLEYINYINPVFLVVSSLSDPFGPIIDILTSFNRSFTEFGYTETGIKFDFWATACKQYFKTYDAAEIQPVQFKYLYLNYNRKPHPHRQRLISVLEDKDLIQYGCNTLGGTTYTVNDTIEDYINYGAADIVGNNGIPNDIYSLGQLGIWNSSFINIVSETCAPGDRLFLSEKIYKPIIGMRPFIINGSVKIYKWLKFNKYDCFDDLFPVQELINNPADAHNIIADTIMQFVNKDITKLYSDILPRLQYNRNLFLNNDTSCYVY